MSWCAVPTPGNPANSLMRAQMSGSLDPELHKPALLLGSAHGAVITHRCAPADPLPAPP